MKINWFFIKNSIINYFIIHIFLSLISLPIIVAWGLPLSWLSPIGNFIFSPLLSLFLLIASFSFFSELIGVSHTIFDRCLEYLAQFWQEFLKLAPSNALYGFHATVWWFLLIIILIAFLSLIHPIMQNPMRRLTVLITLLGISMTILRATQPVFFLYSMPCYQGTITLIRKDNKTIVIDPGYIGSRISASSWITYTFIPELIAKTGSITIDHLVLLKPSILTFDAVDTLIQNISIGHIYLPSMKGTLEGSLKRNFGRFYAHLKQKNIGITRLYDKNYTIPSGDTLMMHMKPKGIKTYQTISYPHFILESTIDDQTIHITGR